MGKEKKNRPHRDKVKGADIKRLFKVLGLSLLIVFLIVAAVSFITNDTNWNIFGKNKGSDSLQDGVINRIDADDVKSIRPYENGIVLLTNSAVQYLDTSGRVIESNKHIYATPEMQVRDKNVFVYDKGGTGCRLEKNAAVYSDITAPGAILCGAIGKKGNYAYSLDNHDGYQSHIFVYSSGGSKQFEWGSASDYCFRMALSDSGNKLAVCVVGVQNAEYYSKVMLFTFNSGQPAYTVEFPGKTVIDLDFISGKRIAVYTDSGVYAIEADGEYSALQEYSSTEIAHSHVNPHGLSATAVIPYGNEQTPLITVFDANHKVLFSHQYSTLISGVICSDANVGVVMFDRVQILNRSGKVLGEIRPGETCERSVIVNNHLFIVTGTGIHRYNIHFDAEKIESVSTFVPSVTGEPETTAVDESAIKPSPSDAAPTAPEDTTAADETTDAFSEGSDAEESGNETADSEEETVPESGNEDETEEILFG